jgi:hypothetical protein
MFSWNQNKLIWERIGDGDGKEYLGSKLKIIIPILEFVIQYINHEIQKLQMISIKIH